MEPENEDTFTYTKKGEDEVLLISLNFTAEKQKVKALMEESGKKKTLLMSSAGENAGKEQEDELLPYEGRIYKLE